VPQFSEQSGSTATVDDSSTPFDFFFFCYFLPRIYDKTYQNRNKQVCWLRRTNKLKPCSIWQTWTGVRLHEIYLFLAVIIHMCLIKKPKLRDYRSTSNFISTQFSGSVMSRNWFTAILSICMSMTMQHTFPEMNSAMTLCTRLGPSWIIC